MWTYSEKIQGTRLNAFSPVEHCTGAPHFTPKFTPGQWPRGWSLNPAILPAASRLPSAFPSQTSRQPSPRSQASGETHRPPATWDYPPAPRLPKPASGAEVASPGNRSTAPAGSRACSLAWPRSRQAARVKNPLLQILEVTWENLYKNTSSAGGL